MKIPEGLHPCVNKALYRLSLGDLTCREMVEYLSSPYRNNTGFSEEDAQKTVRLLQEEGFLDDKRYLKNLVHRLDEKGFGPRRIRQELIRHGFSSSLVDRVGERKVDDTARAVHILKKDSKASHLVLTPQGRKKLTDALVRKGYDYGTAAEAVRQISGEDDSFPD